MICAPRRWRPAARRRPLRPNRKLAALLLVCILLGGMAYFTVSVLNLITQLAVNSACDLMQLKINAVELLAQEFQIATNAFVCLDDLPELRFSVAEIAALEKAQLLID